jgi:acyl transferase domain-containing protein
MKDCQRVSVAAAAAAKLRHRPCSNRHQWTMIPTTTTTRSTASAAVLQCLMLVAVTATAAALPVVQSQQPEAQLRSSMRRSSITVQHQQDDFDYRSNEQRQWRRWTQSVTSAAATDAPTQDEGSINMAIIVILLFVVFVLIYIWFCYCLCCCGYVRLLEFLVSDWNARTLKKN